MTHQHLRFSIPLAAALIAAGLTGCTTTYQLTLMPRSSGALYEGTAEERGGQANVAIAIGDKTYTGTWVATAADRTTSYVSGGFGFWGRRSAIGTSVSVDNPAGGEAKALLQAPDGSGLRCDFRGFGPGRSAGGTCQDDKALLYDVQIRVKETK